ncbi:hypothetical protein BH23GEM9_BH23GEM9_37510 [soil metagenome]
MLNAVKQTGRTLATLEPGESGTVGTIMFGALRALCADIGISEGVGVRCRAGTGGVLVLDTADGRTVSMARDWARFIHLLPVELAGN